MSTDVLLSLDQLTVDFAVKAGTVHAVRGVSLDVRRGEVVGIVGESGSGKSATMLALLGLLAPNARVGGGAVFDGTQVIGLAGEQLRRLRGGRIRGPGRSAGVGRAGRDPAGRRSTTPRWRSARTRRSSASWCWPLTTAISAWWRA